MKKRIWLILLSMCILCACNGSERIYEPLKVSYKEDNYMSRGMIAACYDDKVYYFSDEDGKSGVYVMTQDGSENQLVLECQDIQSLQVLEDKIYVSEQEKEEYRNKRTFGLYEYDLEEKKKKDVIHPLIKDSTADGFPGIGGFFIDESEKVFLNVNRYNDKRKIVSKVMFCQKGDSILTFWEECVLIADIEEGRTRTLFSLYQLGNNCLVNCGVKPDPDDYEQGSLDYKSTLEAYGYNCELDCFWWNQDEFGNRWIDTVRL